MQEEKRRGPKPNHQHLLKAGRLIVKELRERGLNASDAAKELGIGRDYMSMIIHGKRLPSLRVANLIKEFLGVPTDVYVRRES